ncbi:alpha/beta hydrolase [Nostoc sp. CHAB 5836]|nr:alpha/beta hydrolase [Nostoc sp. CHAB 5836]
MGSLLLNPGGPGFSGMSYAVTVAKNLADSPVTKQFDLIGFDPRGVAASTPALDCFTDAEREADKLVNSINSGGKDYTDHQTRQLYQKCAERSGGEDVLAHVGTRDVARDMDLLRAVFGGQALLFRRQLRYPARRDLRRNLPAERAGHGARWRGRPYHRHHRASPRPVRGFPACLRQHGGLLR